MGQDNITAGEVMGVLQGGVVEPGDFERALWQDATIRTVWRPTSLIAGNEERMRNEICPLLSTQFNCNSPILLKSLGPD